VLAGPDTDSRLDATSTRGTPDLSALRLGSKLFRSVGHQSSKPVKKRHINLTLAITAMTVVDSIRDAVGLGDAGGSGACTSLVAPYSQKLTSAQRLHAKQCPKRDYQSNTETHAHTSSSR